MTIGYAARALNAACSETTCFFEHDFHAFFHLNVTFFAQVPFNLTAEQLKKAFSIEHEVHSTEPCHSHDTHTADIVDQGPLQQAVSRRFAEIASLGIWQRLNPSSQLLHHHDSRMIHAGL